MLNAGKTKKKYLPNFLSKTIVYHYVTLRNTRKNKKIVYLRIFFERDAINFMSARPKGILR